MIGNRSGWIVNGVSIAIGSGVLWWAWGGITAPPPMMTQIIGGRRRRW